MNSETISDEALSFLDYPHTCQEDFEWIVKDTGTYSYDRMLLDMEALVKMFPGRVYKKVIGESELGREVAAIIVGADTAENKFFSKGGAHSREYISSLLLMKQAEFYLRNWDNTVNGEKLSAFFDRCQIHFIPMANPDGVMLSQQGLASLDIIKDEDEKRRRIDFLMPLMKRMNDHIAENVWEHDTGWTPPPEGKDDFTYWKNNVNGVDDHYNFWTPEMKRWRKEVFDANPAFLNGPNYVNYIGEQPFSEKEVKAVGDYIHELKPNIFLTVHGQGSVLQWRYGFQRDVDGEKLEQTADVISERLSQFMQYKKLTKYIIHCGPNGYYRLFYPYGYSFNLELGINTYFDDVEGLEGHDACPLRVEQFNTDVVTRAGEKRFCIWHKQKFVPIYTAQYILNRKLVPPAGEAVARKIPVIDN